MCIPLEALRISPIPDIDATVGEVLVHLAPGVDAKHMPERTAVFTAFL